MRPLLISSLLILILILSARTQTNVYVGYTANLNGNLQPCNCQNYELGSIVRLATAVDNLRNQYPDLLLLDSGDFLKSYPIPVANTIMSEFMTFLNFSAITPGDQEFVEGVEFFKGSIASGALPLVSCNVVIPGVSTKQLSRYLIFEQNGVKIGVTGIIHPQSFDFIMARDIEILPIRSSLTTVINEIEKETDLIILLYHSGYEDAMKLLSNFENIDVVISGHSQERFEKKIGRKLVIQAGYDGEYLGLLEIQLSSNNLTFKNTFIEISEQYSENLQMMEQIKQYHETLDKEYY
jgi:2',3'-cyclic-nucleotide 2'-phosphodiesterase (5'-nucleotidase family)